MDFPYIIISETDYNEKKKKIMEEGYIGKKKKLSNILFRHCYKKENKYICSYAFMRNLKNDFTKSQIFIPSNFKGHFEIKDKIYNLDVWGI